MYLLYVPSTLVKNDFVMQTGAFLLSDADSVLDKEILALKPLIIKHPEVAIIRSRTLP